MDDLAGFYDDWASDYDAVHADWRATVRVHGALLAEALHDRGIATGASVLDCTCGIGTQAIGLALAGYRVAGSDISAGEIERARVEASSFGVEAEFAVADLLDLAATLPDTWHVFDAVISANSLTHFATPALLAAVFAQMASVCRPGGVVAVTNRDYDPLSGQALAGDAFADPSARPASTTVQQSVLDGIRRVSFQLWDWAADGRSYRMEDVLMTRPQSDIDAAWTVRSRATRLHAWRRADIEQAAAAAGLTDAVWSQRGVQPIATFLVP